MRTGGEYPERVGQPVCQVLNMVLLTSMGAHIK